MAAKKKAGKPRGTKRKAASRSRAKPSVPVKQPPQEIDQGPDKGGRPSLYRPEFLQIAADHYAEGATDQEVADALGIGVRTLYSWHHQYPAFRQAAKLGKEAADERVERALYHRAVGYEHDTVKIFQGTLAGPVVVPYREHVPPDPGAAKNWLANRQPERWREVQRIEHEHTVVDTTRTQQLRNELAASRPAAPVDHSV